MRRNQPDRPIRFLVEIQGRAISGHGVAFELKHTQPGLVFGGDNQGLVQMTATVINVDQPTQLRRDIGINRKRARPEIQ